MANIPVNATAILATGPTSVTGSFAGFTVLSDTTFSGLIDANGGFIPSISFLALQTIPLFVTSASISSGDVLFYT
jgi:hypothetical protein